MNLENLFSERWPNFTPYEVFSPVTISKHVHFLDMPSMDALQDFRRFLDVPFLINHANLRYRGICCFEEHLKVPGRAFNSMHYVGKAFDVTPRHMALEDFFTAALNSGYFGGVGLYRSWVHLDTRFRLPGSEPVTWKRV